jgi:hypothetical protein
MASISASDLISFGEQYIGTPYVWGGNSLSSGVDCSGLVQQIYAHFGIQLPRTTYDQIGQGTAVDSSHLQPGDLVFFSAGAGGNSPDHVAIYIGNGQMLEAPRTGESVRIQSMDIPYYMDRFVGARRISGLSQGPGSGNYSYTGGQNVAAQLNPQELASEYGWSYAFLQSNPELKDKFTEAVAQNWSADKFKAEVMTTNWWKQTSQTARQLQAQQYTDPATYNASMLAMTTQIKQEAAQMGAPIGDAQIAKMAKLALMSGYDQGQIQDMLGQHVNFLNNGTLGGAAGAFAHLLHQYAYAQGVSLSDQAVKNQAALIARGLMTQEDAMQQVRAAAISSFPAYADQINAGATMKDIAQPYIQTASQLLERPDSSFSLQHPLIRDALSGTNSDGQPTGQTLSQFEASIRQSPQWLQTQNAQNSIMQTGRSVLQMMGLSN